MSIIRDRLEIIYNKDFNNNIVDIKKRYNGLFIHSDDFNRNIAENLCKTILVELFKNFINFDSNNIIISEPNRKLEWGFSICCYYAISIGTNVIDLTDILIDELINNSSYRKLVKIEDFIADYNDYKRVSGALEPIEGRYKVAEIDNRIIAVSGILQENITPYNGYEVTWTCCLPEYRKNGIICNILMNCISDIKEDSFNVYCSC